MIPRFEIVVGEDGVAEPPVKVGSGFTNAQGVYLIYGQWLTGQHTVVVGVATGFNKPSPAQVGGGAASAVWCAPSAMLRHSVRRTSIST